jgi:cell division protein FtsQ
MSQVAAPSDRRFRRAHVKPARKRKRLRALAAPLFGCGLIGLIVAYGLYRGSSAAVHARVLPITRIVVRGNDRLSKGEVLAVLSGLQGQSLIWTNLESWRTRLLASPWVREAALRRSLPSTVEVTIRERQPVSIARLNGEMYLVDDGGALIDQYGPQYADLDLPIVDGLAASPGGDGSMTDEARADLSTRVITALRGRPEIAKRLSQMDVTDLHNATVILSGDGAVIQLGDERFLPRLEAYLDLASALRQRVPDIDYVDLRFDDRIYVRPAPGGAAPRQVRATVPSAAAVTPRRDKAAPRHGKAANHSTTTK